MFQFSAFAYYTPILQIGRLPHSETTGSIPICGSPVLIAACRVLLRLWEPRHPPCALVYFLYRTALLLPYGCFSAIRSRRWPLLPSLSLSSCFLPICQRTSVRSKDPGNKEQGRCPFSLFFQSFIQNLWRITDSNR